MPLSGDKSKKALRLGVKSAMSRYSSGRGHFRDRYYTTGGVLFPPVYGLNYGHRRSILPGLQEPCHQQQGVDLGIATRACPTSLKNRKINVLKLPQATFIEDPAVSASAKHH